MIDSSMDINPKIQKQQEIYKRVKVLGTGSFGKAFLVKQIKTDQFYVIKQIFIGDMNAEQQEKALRQAKILQALSHPNIVKFKQVYRTAKMKLNIVMEFADGGDLSSKIKEAKKKQYRFAEADILNWFTQICLAVKHIHDRKIIHRDLKAQNIFLTSDNCVKIGDFGVSRVLQKTQMNAKTMVGSPYYLSPQIIQNKPYSFQTDIWSLGALLFQMCSLSPPFTANNLQFLALKIVKGSYGQIPPQYSYELRSLIKSMLNTDSSRRPTINKILTSRLISRRISNFLTESKRMDEFSHTTMHNHNILTKNAVKATQPKGLKAPPNLMQIQKQFQNKSQIYISNQNFQTQNSSKKQRPYTPQLAIKKKGPNNFFNRKQSAKVISNEVNQLNDLIQIKPTTLQIHQKQKLPKVTLPSFFQKKKDQQSNVTCKNPVFTEKQPSKVSFLKKKQIENIQVNQLKQKKQIQKNQKNSEKKQIKQKPKSITKKENVIKNKIQNNVVLAKNVSKKRINSQKKQIGIKKMEEDFKMQIVSQQAKKKQEFAKQKQKIVKKGKNEKSQKKIIKRQIQKQQKKKNSQIYQEEKCNSQKQILQRQTEKFYENEQFQFYQDAQDLKQQNDADLSLSLSASLAQRKPNNFEIMLNQMQNIQKMIQKAQGQIQTLPILGKSFRQLQQLSDEIRDDDSQFQITEIQQKKVLKNNQSNVNLRYISNQQQLQNMRMNLQDLFGQNNIIFAYNKISKAIEKQGLDMNQNQLIKEILFQNQSINQELLKKYFRLIVTIITMESQMINSKNETE